LNLTNALARRGAINAIRHKEIHRCLKCTVQIQKPTYTRTASIQELATTHPHTASIQELVRRSHVSPKSNEDSAGLTRFKTSLRKALKERMRNSD